MEAGYKINLEDILGMQSPQRAIGEFIIYRALEFRKYCLMNELTSDEETFQINRLLGLTVKITLEFNHPAHPPE